MFLKNMQSDITIVRTSFDLNPKHDWDLAQQAQTINL